MTKVALAIVDYGLGNLASIERALRRVGLSDLSVTSDPETIAGAERLIIPGVGSFGDGMRGLRERGLIEPIRLFARKGQPLLGICLGMQLLMAEGSEFGTHEGLGLVPGKTTAYPTGAERFKIPHVGWNGLRAPRAGAWEGTILSGLGPASQMYFVHSFVAAPENRQDVLAETFYGGHSFCSALRRGPMYGCQFHPEKSGPAGLSILAAFAGLKP